MALIRQSSSATLTRDAVVLDLGDLMRQGEQMRTKARVDADRLLVEARAERERLIAGAAEEGRKSGAVAGQEEGRRQGEAQGRAAALAEMKDKLAKLEAGWSAALAAFESERDRMLLDARQDVVRLAARVAELVTKRALTLEPERVADQLSAVLAMVAKPTRLVVRANPEDLSILQEALPALQDRYRAATHVEIQPDPTLERGSCTASTAGGGTIDASVAGQLERIAAALLPAATPTPGEPTS
jgi:flagellar biosynthesis/type III secretory pathway protein FliH